MFEVLGFIIAVVIIAAVLRRPAKADSIQSKPPPDSLSISDDSSLVTSYSLPEYDVPVLSFSRSRVPCAPHPLRGWTNLGMYAIRGIDPESGKRRRRHIYALDIADAEQNAPSTGLMSPFSIKEVQRPMATERQIAYCKQLGITVSEHESQVDASALICMVHDGETPADRITDQQWSTACSSHVCVSALSCQRFYRSAMQAFSKPIPNLSGGETEMDLKQKAAHDIAMLYLETQVNADCFSYSVLADETSVIDEMVTEYIRAFRTAEQRLDLHSFPE